eukprot:scaffold1986_cov117-Isochrysis_galbana.AAC.1
MDPGQLIAPWDAYLHMLSIVGGEILDREDATLAATLSISYKKEEEVTQKEPHSKVMIGG